MGQILRRVAWLRACVKYGVVKAWPVLLVGAIVIVCYCSARFFSPAEPTIRLTGMVLQMLGFAMTMWQLLETRKALNLPNWLEGTVRYFKGFPKFNKTISMSATLGALGMVGKANVTVGRNPKAKIKERVERLERDVDALNIRITDLADQNSAEMAALKLSLLKEIETLRSELSNVETKMIDLVGGGTTLQVVGVFYFAIGLFLASASVEISKWMPGLSFPHQ